MRPLKKSIHWRSRYRSVVSSLMSCRESLDFVFATVMLKLYSLNLKDTYWSLQGNNTQGLLTQRQNIQSLPSASRVCFYKTCRQDSSEAFQRAYFSWILLCLRV
ncbi:hypothetical protein A2U01_0046435, partial [Trifolium medium]|nr:hypothetical protein [Trifolium medium]